MRRSASLALSALADRIDGLADKVEELEVWISGFEVWKYPGLTRELEEAREETRQLLEDYDKLARLYTEKTGEVVPFSRVVLMADLRPLQEAMSRLGEWIRQGFLGGLS